MKVFWVMIGVTGSCTILLVSTVKKCDVFVSEFGKVVELRINKKGGINPNVPVSIYFLFNLF